MRSLYSNSGFGTEKNKKGIRKKYDVNNVMHIPEIAEKAFINSRKWKEYILPSGKCIKIQGYEDKALEELLLTFKEEEILHSRKDMPKIWYFDDSNVKHRYYPDFYIPNKNLIIEVKSEYTWHNNLNINLKKKEATENLDYNYILLVY